MQCQQCRKVIGDDELIYRFPTGYKSVWYARWGGSTGTICATCVPAVEAMAGKVPWRSPEPCDVCGRPIILSLRRKRPRFVVCSTTCSNAVYSGRAWARRQRAREDRICMSCGTSFTPARRDTRYCSHACRQKAYRQRVEAGLEESP